MKHYKSEQLLDELRAAGVSIKLCDEKLLQSVVRRYFVDIHREAVEATIMAKNKPTAFVEPNFED